VLVAPRIRKLLAPNPSPYTGPGTNTYLVGEREIVVIDPGPDDPVHTDAILEAVGALDARVALILVTHHHLDHLPGADRLRHKTGAPLAAHEGIHHVDRALMHGQQVPADGETLEVIATPGHASTHLCFLLRARELLFSGDHILGWGTAVVNPPDGDMVAYLDSLALLRQYPIRRLLPGHWDPVDDAPAKITEYIDHRQMRERQILTALRLGDETVPAIVARLYADVDPRLHRAAGGSVTAHLLKLEHEGRVVRRDDRWLLTDAERARLAADPSAPPPHAHGG
jgi:glyoxylase-like metal-dependent hydrolase (beta-lactamase superfamily II)